MQVEKDKVLIEELVKERRKGKVYYFPNGNTSAVWKALLKSGFRFGGVEWYLVDKSYVVDNIVVTEKIRKIIQQPFEVLEDDRFLQPCMKMWAERFEKTERDYLFTYDILKRLSDEGYLKVFSLHIDGKLAGAEIDFIGDRTVYGLFAPWDENYSKYSPGHYAMYCGIKYAIRIGYEYDMSDVLFDYMKIWEPKERSFE